MSYKDFYHFMLERFSQPAELVTSRRNQPFTLFVENENLYVKNASGNVRRLDKKSVAAFIERYEDTGSHSPAFYKDVTFNASYLLAVMTSLSPKNESASSFTRFHSGEVSDSEQQYQTWLKNNPNGFVLNILKSSEGKNYASAARFTCLHSSTCASVNNNRSYSQPEPFTGGDYFKVCAENLEELETEALNITDLKEIKRCKCIK